MTTAHVPGPMMTRCAWCDRYDAGDRWLEADAVRAFLRPDEHQGVTHGICPECVAELQARGLSR